MRFWRTNISHLLTLIQLPSFWQIFAVRQWPGNEADLCLDKVVRKCCSFVIICQAFPTKKVGGIPVLGDMTRKQPQPALLTSDFQVCRPLTCSRLCV